MAAQAAVKGVAEQLPPPPGRATPPAPYVFLVGEQVITDVSIKVEDTIQQVLHWIGFRKNQTPNSLVDDDFGSYDDVRVMLEKDISNMATSLANRTATDGRMYFGTRRIKY